jgi:hypothetical protein
MEMLIPGVTSGTGKLKSSDVEQFLVKKSSKTWILTKVNYWNLGFFHGLIIYKDTKPKCRLYWCLIQFVDWRYSQ